MKSILIIGMGKFGQILAAKMQELGNHIMIVDKDEEIINGLAHEYTNAVIGNCTNESVLKSLGINNFDICFVTIGNDFQSSLEITSQLKEMGAKYVIAKAERDIQAKFLLRNGADEIVYPERDSAIKLAIRCNANNIFDNIELTQDYSIFEIPVLPQWVNETLSSVDVRKKFKITIIAVKNNNVLFPIPSADYVFKPDDHVVVIGKHSDVFKLTSKI
ncbi:MAG: potassium channel family protein [Christensenellales bacterium]